MGRKIGYLEQYAYSTVFIKIENAAGKKSGGTGFCYMFENPNSATAKEQEYWQSSSKDVVWGVPVLVTNKHVIKGSVKGWLHLTRQGSDFMPMDRQTMMIEFENFESMWIKHPDPDVDLCILPLQDIIMQAREENRPPYIIYFGPKDLLSEEDRNSMDAVENILVIGYPNGIYDVSNNRPIFKSGITATDARLDYNGESIFLIDSAIFPGSSGSPVILAESGMYMDGDRQRFGVVKLRLIGIISKTFIHIARQRSEFDKPLPGVEIPNNLGLAIHCRRLVEMGEIIKSRC